MELLFVHGMHRTLICLAFQISCSAEVKCKKIARIQLSDYCNKIVLCFYSVILFDNLTIQIQGDIRGVKNRRVAILSDNKNVHK